MEKPQEQLNNNGDSLNAEPSSQQGSVSSPEAINEDLKFKSMEDVEMFIEEKKKEIRELKSKNGLKKLEKERSAVVVLLDEESIRNNPQRRAEVDEKIKAIDQKIEELKKRAQKLESDLPSFELERDTIKKLEKERSAAVVLFNDESIRNNPQGRAKVEEKIKAIDQKTEELKKQIIDAMNKQFSVSAEPKKNGETKEDDIGEKEDSKWEKIKGFFADKNNRAVGMKIGWQAIKSMASAGASIAGVKILHDLPVYLIQKVGAIKNKSQFNDIMQNLAKEGLSPEQMEGKKIGEIIDAKKFEEIAKKIENLNIPDEEKDALVMKLSGLIEDYHNQRESLENGTSKQLKNTLDNFVRTKISGVQVIKESLNTALVATGAVTLRLAAYPLLSVAERYFKSKREAAMNEQEFKVMRDVFYGGLKENFKKLTFTGEGGKVKKTVDFIASMGRLAKYAGFTKMAFDDPNSIAGNFHKIFETLGSDNRGHIMLDNLLKNLNRIPGAKALQNLVEGKTPAAGAGFVVGRGVGQTITTEAGGGDSHIHETMVTETGEIKDADLDGGMSSQLEHVKEQLAFQSDDYKNKYLEKISELRGDHFSMTENEALQFAAEHPNLHEQAMQAMGATEKMNTQNLDELRNALSTTPGIDQQKTEAIYAALKGNGLEGDKLKNFVGIIALAQQKHLDLNPEELLKIAGHNPSAADISMLNNIFRDDNIVGVGKNENVVKHILENYKKTGDLENAIATVQKGEGMEHAARRLIEAEPEKYGFKSLEEWEQANPGKSDGEYWKALHAYSAKEGHQLAIKSGFVKILDKDHIEEIRISGQGGEHAIKVDAEYSQTPDVHGHLEATNVNVEINNLVEKGGEAHYEPILTAHNGVTSGGKEISEVLKEKGIGYEHIRDFGAEKVVLKAEGGDKVDIKAEVISGGAAETQAKELTPQLIEKKFEEEMGKAHLLNEQKINIREYIKDSNHGWPTSQQLNLYGSMQNSKMPFSEVVKNWDRLRYFHTSQAEGLANVLHQVAPGKNTSDTGVLKQAELFLGHAVKSVSRDEHGEVKFNLSDANGKTKELFIDSDGHIAYKGTGFLGTGALPKKHDLGSGIQALNDAKEKLGLNISGASESVEIPTDATNHKVVPPSLSSPEDPAKYPTTPKDPQVDVTAKVVPPQLSSEAPAEVASESTIDTSADDSVENEGQPKVADDADSTEVENDRADLIPGVMRNKNDYGISFNEQFDVTQQENIINYVKNELEVKRSLEEILNNDRNIYGDREQFTKYESFIKEKINAINNKINEIKNIASGVKKGNINTNINGNLSPLDQAKAIANFIKNGTKLTTSVEKQESAFDELDEQ